MSVNPRKFLNDILDRATFVSEFLSDKSLDQLLLDRPTRSAVERELMVLGEALYRLHKTYPTIAERIDSWKEIIGFRHVLVHGYDSLNMRILWEVTQDDLGPLIEQI